MSDIPQGFILSEAALYSFKDQDVYPDLISFCSAIPDHLRPLFLIPITLSPVEPTLAVHVSMKTANTEDADLFGTKTFVYDDAESTIPTSDPGSIFDIDGADEITHHQDLEEDQDKNIQVPTDTSYMSDVDVTDSGFSYPYRTEESPVRHSSIIVARLRGRIALQSDDLEQNTPQKIRDNAESCSVQLISYDKRGRVYTFSVTCGNNARTVRASLTDLDHIAMECDCPFWKWNGPEFHAKENSYMLGTARGTAEPPDVRDPDRDYWLCKHAYAVIARMDSYVDEVVQETKESPEEPVDEQEVMQELDENWDELEDIVRVPLDEFEEPPEELDDDEEPEEELDDDEEPEEELDDDEEPEESIPAPAMEEDLEFEEELEPESEPESEPEESQEEGDPEDLEFEEDSEPEQESEPEEDKLEFEEEFEEESD